VKDTRNFSYGFLVSILRNLVGEGRMTGGDRGGMKEEVGGCKKVEGMN
jgi:hypothetical protein